MKAEFSSSLAVRETMRLVIQRTQGDLARAQVELSSGQHADFGLALGARTGALVDWRTLSRDLETLDVTNGVVGQRLQQTQSALSAIGELAQGFFASLSAARLGGGDRAVLVADAKARLAALGDILAATSNGVHMFSGQNVDQVALRPYLDEPVSAAQSAVQSGFAVTFGIAADDPGVAQLSGAQMAAYLDGVFAQHFADPAWGSLFSNASDLPIEDRIAQGETISTPATANDPAIRKLVSVLVAAIDSGVENLNGEAFEAFAARAVSVAGDVGADVARMQALTGVAQERLAKASERITIQKAMVEKQIGENEDVDSYQVATRLNQLATALQTAYAVTARLQNMSLLYALS